LTALLVKQGIAARLEQSIATALKLASGLVTVAIVGGKEHTFSEKLACPDCGISVPQLEPRSFSFNSPYGACPACNGLGSNTISIRPKSSPIGPARSSMAASALAPALAILKRTLELGAYAHGFDLETPFENSPRASRTCCCTAIRRRTAAPRGEKGSAGKKSKGDKGFRFPGILKFLERNFEESNSDSYREWITQYMSATQLRHCRGKRLRPESLAVKLGGLSIADFTSLSLSSARPAVDKILAPAFRTPKGNRQASARGSLPNASISFLPSASAISAWTVPPPRSPAAKPSASVWPRKSARAFAAFSTSRRAEHRPARARQCPLLGSLEHLRNLGNTVLVVEHDEDTIRRADFVVDLGPGAGNAVGYLVAQGKPAQSKPPPNRSLAQYLSGAAKIAVPKNGAAPTASDSDSWR